jgi:hypothetical protein
LALAAKLYGSSGSSKLMCCGTRSLVGCRFLPLVLPKEVRGDFGVERLEGGGPADDDWESSAKELVAVRRFRVETRMFAESGGVVGNVCSFGVQTRSLSAEE